MLQGTSLVQSPFSQNIFMLYHTSRGISDSIHLDTAGSSEIRVSLIWNRVHHTGTWPALSKFSQLQAWEITKLKFFVTNLIQCTKAKKHFWIRRAFFQNNKKRSRTDFRLLGVCRQVFLLSEECLMI